MDSFYEVPLKAVSHVISIFLCKESRKFYKLNTTKYTPSLSPYSKPLLNTYCVSEIGLSAWTQEHVV